MQYTDFRNKVRQFVDEAIRPNLNVWEASGEYPLVLHALAAEKQILSLGQNPEHKFKDDVFRREILLEELALIGSQAMEMALASHFVSLSAIEQAPSLYKKISPQIFKGTKTIVLALTEPQAGTDLRNIQCLATTTVNNEYIINGNKSFICNGARADYILVAAQLDDKLTLFLIETAKNNIESNSVSCLGWQGLPISSLSFTNVRAQKIGETGQAGSILQRILLHERLNLAVMANASAKLTFEMALEYSKQRHVKGKPLFEQQIIRHRLAEMHSKIEICQAYINQYINKVLISGPDGREVSIAKNQAVAVLEEVAAQSIQIHGASGCIAGSRPEQIYRDARLLGLGGGSTEILNEIISRSL
jgi:acyl-CoA dehydrogenase